MAVVSLVKVLPFFAATTILAAVNYPPIPADLTTPVQQRLAIDGPNSMSIGWNTFKKLEKSCVSYGLSSTQLLLDACSTSSVTYPSSRTWSNAVTITGLEPSTVYYYKINSTNSTVEHFLSPRSVGQATPFNMSVVIDLGVYGENGYTTTKRDAIPQIQPELNHSTIGALARTVDQYEFVLHPGDFAYADDWFETFSNLLDGKNAYEAILEVCLSLVHNLPLAKISPTRTSTASSPQSPAEEHTWSPPATTKQTAKRSPIPQDSVPKASTTSPTS